jgi:SAM-dependent methyltransferase
MIEPKYSKSEKNGLNLIRSQDKNIYSVGISTAGFAEIEMVKGKPSRKVIATSIHKKGLQDTRNIIEEQGLSNQIVVKFEDISKKLMYKNESFDYVYARLVLHYLNNRELQASLNELHRVLKKKGHIYVVVRSIKDPDAGKIDRIFYTKDSISTKLRESGFTIDYVIEYKEQLYHDYLRTQPHPLRSHLIEIHAKR